VFLRDGVLILKGNGDNYTGTTQGVDGNGVNSILTLQTHNLVYHGQIGLVGLYRIIN
jgi:hypothetical protein